MRLARGGPPDQQHCDDAEECSDPTYAPCPIPCGLAHYRSWRSCGCRLLTCRRRRKRCHTLEPSFADLQCFVEPSQSIAAVILPVERLCEGVAIQALPRAVGHCGGHQYLSRSGQTGNAGSQIDSESLDAGMHAITVGSWPFA